jgi:hypothetical protein
VVSVMPTYQQLYHPGDVRSTVKIFHLKRTHFS